MNVVCTDPVVKVVSVSSNVHPAEFGSQVSKSGSQSISITNQMQFTEVDTAGETSNSDDVQPTEADTAVL